MTQTWVVDSNCFIHLGSMAPNSFVKDATKILKSNAQMLYVTPGVHDEIRNVRFQRWSNKPRVLDEFESLMSTVAIDDGHFVQPFEGMPT